jgi:hypothetical protein
VSTLPPWLTIAQVAEHCEVDRTEVYYKMLSDLEVRRIGIRGGVVPWGRLIRVERASLLRLRGESAVPAEVLPHWVTLPPAADLLPAQRAPDSQNDRLRTA